MDLERYDNVCAALRNASERIENGKRPAYTGGNRDVLHNFKEAGKKMGITSLQSWGIYFVKHSDAVFSFAKDPKAPQAESIIGRFADATNYLKLGLALAIDELGPEAVGMTEDEIASSF